MTYTINSIDQTKKHITVTFSQGGGAQTMCNIPLEDATALDDFLSTYSYDYIPPTATAIDPACLTMVGVAKTPKAK